MGSPARQSISTPRDCAAWWTGLNYVRMTVGGIGWLCALRALSLSGLNGTYVNREPVASAVLANGDEIQIGKFRLVFLTRPRRADTEGLTSARGVIIVRSVSELAG